MSEGNLEELSKAELIRELRKLQAAALRSATMSDTIDPSRLIHDLHVQQIELEMQNRELREAQGLLEESRSRYGDLYDFAPVGYCSLDADGCIREINLTGAALLDAPREQLVGKPFAVVAPLEDRRAFHDHLKQRAERHAQVTTELVLSSKKLRPRTVQMLSIPVPEGSGAPGAYRTALIDVSAQKELEQKLRFLVAVGETLASSLDYPATLAAVARLAVPLLADLCITDVLDEDGVVHCIDVRFADLGKQETLAESIKHFVPRSGWQTPQAKVMATGEPMLLSEISDQLRGAIGDDEPDVDVLRTAGVKSIMIVPLKARGRTFGTLTFAAAESDRRYSSIDLVFAEDIGRRAAIAMDNARLYDKARRAVRARDATLGVVSHDLRDPLGVILMKAEVILDTPDSEHGGAQNRKAADSIRRSGDLMTRLIQDLLDVAKIEAERFSIEKNIEPITALVTETVDMLQSLATQKRLRLETELGAAEGLHVECDRDRILQVFANLIGNAIKFSREREAIEIRAEVRGAEVCCSVTDRGPGILPSDLPHVFERFWQAPSTARMGTGLGLSIAKGIIDAHGGRLWLESEWGVGSTFFFTLPLAVRRHEQPDARAVSAVAGPMGARSQRSMILVVDDGLDVRDALQETLERKGYDVVAKGDGAAALEYLSSAAAPSLIVLDLTMTGVDGWAFLAQRNHASHLKAIPVIVVSGQRDVEQRVLAARAAYLQKPIRIDRLIEMIEKLKVRKIGSPGQRTRKISTSTTL